jgi:hypothetical protein
MFPSNVVGLSWPWLAYSSKRFLTPWSTVPRRFTIVDQQAVDKQDFLAGRIRRLKHDGAPIFTVLHTGENRGFNQFCLMFQFLHGDLGYSQA